MTFGVILYAETFFLFALDSFNRFIVEVLVRDARIAWKARSVDAVAMILRRHIDLVQEMIFNWVISATVPERKLISFGT